MILIARRQRIAQQNAKTLINFDNVIVDTDFASISFRPEGLHNHMHGRTSDPSLGQFQSIEKNVDSKRS